MNDYTKAKGRFLDETRFELKEKNLYPIKEDEISFP